MMGCALLLSWSLGPQATVRSVACRRPVLAISGSLTHNSRACDTYGLSVMDRGTFLKEWGWPKGRRSLVQGTGTPKWAEGLDTRGALDWGRGMEDGWEQGKAALRSTLGQLCGLGAEPVAFVLWGGGLSTIDDIVFLKAVCLFWCG